MQRFQQLDLELAPYEGLADKLAEQRVSQTQETSTRDLDVSLTCILL